VLATASPTGYFNLNSLDESSGRTTWSKQHLNNEIAFAGSFVVVDAPGGQGEPETIQAVDSVTGRTQWKSAVPANMHVAGLVAAEGRVFAMRNASESHGSLVSLNITSGRPEWATGFTRLTPDDLWPSLVSGLLFVGELARSGLSAA
jgi:outer membrane protein assembly factor BamB